MWGDKGAVAKWRRSQLYFPGSNSNGGQLKIMWHQNPIKNPRNISWESKLPYNRRKWKCRGWATPCGYHARWGVTIIMVTPTIAEGSNLHLKLGVGHLLLGHNWVSWEGQSVTISKAGVLFYLATWPSPFWCRHHTELKSWWVTGDAYHVPIKIWWQ